MQPFRSLVRHHCVIADAAAGSPMVGVVSPTDATFALFYEQHLAPSLRLAHLIVGSPTAAQDVVHDVFLSIHRRWASIDNPGGYLRTALINRCRSAQRRQIVERLHLRRPSTETTAIPEVDETWRAVQLLPAEQRTVLVLRFYADLSLAEIATEIGKPVGTVKSTLHRALARLKEELR